MKRFEKIIEGKTVRMALKDIVIRKDGMATYNPTEEMVLADGWIEIPAQPSSHIEEWLLERAKEAALKRINDFDSSNEVNGCVIRKDGIEMDYWADKHERDSLKNAVKDCISAGREIYRLDLRELGVSLEIPCENLVGMLSALEVYAIDCYNKTTDHIFAVKGLTTAEEVEAYDYRDGYPEKIVFEL